jgi:hypothetical protein
LSIAVQISRPTRGQRGFGRLIEHELPSLVRYNLAK